jgi:hypothetical protein
VLLLLPLWQASQDHQGLTLRILLLLLRPLLLLLLRLPQVCLSMAPAAVAA